MRTVQHLALRASLYAVALFAGAVALWLLTSSTAHAAVPDPGSVPAPGVLTSTTSSAPAVVSAPSFVVSGATRTLSPISTAAAPVTRSAGTGTLAGSATAAPVSALDGAMTKAATQNAATATKAVMQSAAGATQIVQQTVSSASNTVAQTTVQPVTRALGPVTRQLATTVTRVITPVAQATAPVTSPVVASVTQISAPVSQVVQPIANIAKPVAATVSQITAPAAPIVAPVVSSVSQPVAQLVAPVTQAVTPTLAQVVAPVTQIPALALPTSLGSPSSGAQLPTTLPHSAAAPQAESAQISSFGRDAGSLNGQSAPTRTPVPTSSNPANMPGSSLFETFSSTVNRSSGSGAPFAFLCLLLLALLSRQASLASRERKLLNRSLCVLLPPG